MIFKAMVFLKRKDGLSRGQFIDYYENAHHQKFHKYFPPIPDYRRNYPVYDDPLTFMGPFDRSASLTDSSMTYDCITEIWFEDRKGLEELFRLLRDPDIAKMAAADEEKFLKRDSMRVVVVEEYRYDKHRKRRFT